jgi:hypothetical protein
VGGGDAAPWGAARRLAPAAGRRRDHRAAARWRGAAFGRAVCETKEQIAGYDVIECEDLNQAIEVACEHPVAKFGAIEVRPFWEE